MWRTGGSRDGPWGSWFSKNKCLKANVQSIQKVLKCKVPDPAASLLSGRGLLPSVGLGTDAGTGDEYCLVHLT